MMSSFHTNWRQKLLEKWWSPSMGRMTSPYMMENKSHVWNHQPENHGSNGPKKWGYGSCRRPSPPSRSRRPGRCRWHPRTSCNAQGDWSGPALAILGGCNWHWHLYSWPLRKKSLNSKLESENRQPQISQIIQVENGTWPVPDRGIGAWHSVSSFKCSWNTWKNILRLLSFCRVPISYPLVN